MSQHDPSAHPVLTRIRPRFQVDLPLSPQALEEGLRAGLTAPDAPCLGHVKHGYASLALPAADQHYWSPRLTLTIEEHDGGSRLRGLYGPRAEVWTMFVFFYALLGFGIVMTAIVGLSRASLGRPSTILWAVPALAVAFATLWLVSYSGQKLGSGQMHVLHGFVERCCGREI
jgi:hypothetical protein